MDSLFLLSLILGTSVVYSRSKYAGRISKLNLIKTTWIRSIVLVLLFSIAFFASAQKYGWFSGGLMVVFGFLLWSGILILMRTQEPN